MEEPGLKWWNLRLTYVCREKWFVILPFLEILKNCSNIKLLLRKWRGNYCLCGNHLDWMIRPMLYRGWYRKLVDLLDQKLWVLQNILIPQGPERILLKARISSLLTYLYNWRIGFGVNSFHLMCIAYEVQIRYMFGRIWLKGNSIYLK